MNREEKAQIIQELTEKFSKYPNFYVCDGTGMTAQQVTEFRKICFAKGMEYQVVKNTLIVKALANLSNTDYTPFNEKVLKGMSGILFADLASANAPAKLLKEFYKTGVENPKLKGASISADFYIGVNQLDSLVALKSKNELIGDIIGLLQSPAQNVISALQSSGGKLAGVLKTLSEKPE